MKKIKIALLVVLCMSFTVGLFGCKKKDDIGKVSLNLSNYDMDLEFFDEDKRLYGKQNLDYVNNSNDILKEVYFHLYVADFTVGAKTEVISPNKKAQCYPFGESFAKLHIIRVTVDGADVCPNYEGEDNDIMKVGLNKTLFPNERVLIYIEYEINLPNSLHRFGYNEHSINLCNFYPQVCVYNGEWDKNSYIGIGDPFFSDMANYYVNISFDEKYKIAHTGEEKNSSLKDKKLVNIEAKCVRDFAFILGDYEVLKKSVDGVDFYYYYYDDQNSEKALQCAIDSVKTFSKLFVDYPYKTYTIVKTDFIQGGMEYPNLSMISSGSQNYDDYLHVIVHETAHQWWYNLVGNNEYKEGYLDEALTEYSAVLFYDYNTGYNYNHKDMVNTSHDNYVFYNSIYKNVYKELNSKMDRPLNEFDTEPEYTYNVYVKGVLMYNSLYHLVGQKKFVAGLKCYVNNYQYKIANREGLINSFSEGCKTDLKNFFDCWLDGKTIIS